MVSVPALSGPGPGLRSRPRGESLHLRDGTAPEHERRAHGRAERPRSIPARAGAPLRRARGRGTAAGRGAPDGARVYAQNRFAASVSTLAHVTTESTSTHSTAACAPAPAAP